MTRRLSGLVIVDGTDDEYWPQSDERVHREFPVQMVLEVNQPASAIEIPDVRWGGECRVEVRLTARALAEGVVQIEGNAKFFEGTSEGTQDLADERTSPSWSPREASRHITASNSATRRSAAEIMLRSGLVSPTRWWSDLAEPVNAANPPHRLFFRFSSLRRGC